MTKMLTLLKMLIKQKRNLISLSNREKMTTWKHIQSKYWVALIKRVNMNRCNSLKFTAQKMLISSLK